MRSVIIEGSISYNSNSQILNSEYFREILCELILDSEEKRNSLLPFFEKFKKSNDSFEVAKKYDIDGLIQLMIALSVNTVEYVDVSPYYGFPKMSNKKEILVMFIESVFNLWRNKHRFMIKNDSFTQTSYNRINKQMMIVKNNTDLKSLVLSVYRQILVNISDTRLKVLRQLPSGAQVGFLTDYPNIKEEVKLDCDWLYERRFVWSTVFEPPVIFYTRSNKRRGIFKVKDEPILKKIKVENPEDWLMFPIHVGPKLIFVLVYKEYLSLAAGLVNLYEIASFNIIENTKPDGIYFFGLSKDNFESEEDYNGIIYKEKDGTYVGMVGDDPSIDYFGYMKKVILTIHNLIVIDESRLPIHGALAQIKLMDGRAANIMIMGDSGAGKSETLDALNRLKSNVSEVNILIDDMGSLDILTDGTVVAYGTETGAFVRLDDLQPGYAYSAMDRSIFINPNEVNARVIVPYSNYDEIIRPTKVDYFLYANNYVEIKENEKPLHFFDSTEEAYKVFSKGARMAKGTTAEKGLTYSYFANPFGAIQRKEKHEKIAKHYIDQMIKNGIKVGELRTQLGINGYEEEGPMIAAKNLLSLLNEEL